MSEKEESSSSTGKIDRYLTRTVEHIHRVQKNMLTLVTSYRDYLSLEEENIRQLMRNVMKHDRSKFSEVQFRPYIELTEYYHQRKKLGNTEYDYPSEETRNDVDSAVEDHYCQENHHPERLCLASSKDNFTWTFYNAIETACDLQAMAEEFNEGTCRDYFENVWKKKQEYNFSSNSTWEKTLDVMDMCIRCFEEEVESDV